MTTPAPAAAGGPRTGTAAGLPPAVLLLVAGIVVLWSALPALLQTVPHADNVEQLGWAHSLEWGYMKHPPLPTWLLHGAVALFGPSALLTYTLAMLCAGAALLIVWAAARPLLGEAGALLALAVTAGDYYLMGRGSFLNHNTVMLPFVAASAWAVLRIVAAAPRPGERTDRPPAQGPQRRPHDWRPWLLLGLLQGLGLLTKYQMAVVIAANALALLSCGAWRQPGFVRNALLACLATATPLAPHLLWLQSHDFSTFNYAGHSLLAALPFTQRLTHTLGFLVQQVGRLAPAALVLGLALRAAPQGSGGTGASAVDTTALRALAILALTPLALVVLLSLVAGVAPQKHWGATTTLLLPLLATTLVLARRSGAAPARRPALLACLLVQALAVAWNVGAAVANPAFHHRFAAEGLARQAQEYWHANAPGEIHVVIGPDWEAGAIGLLLPARPAVMASGQRAQAPWITDEQITRCGALVLWRPETPPLDQVGPDFAARVQDVTLLEAMGPGSGTSRLQAGIIAPLDEGCP